MRALLCDGVEFICVVVGIGVGRVVWCELPGGGDMLFVLAVCGLEGMLEWGGDGGEGMVLFWVVWR